MANGTLPRAGTVEIIQEFGSAPATPARPILNPVIVGASFQIVDQEFAGFYQGRFSVGDELVGTGDGIQTEFFLNNTPVVVNTVEAHIGSITGTLLVQGTDYTVDSAGLFTLTPAGLAAVGLNAIHAAYSYTPDQTYTYPGIKQGAEIQDPNTDVEVFFRTAEDIFDITTGFGVIRLDSSVIVPGDLQPELGVTTANGQIEITAASDTIVDTSLDFFSLGVRPGDVLRFITDPTELQFTDSIVSSDTTERIVLTIPTANSITVSPDVTASGGKVEYEIIRKGTQVGDILISYTARRIDLQNQLLEFESVEDVDNQLGPIVPENPLAFALSKCLGATDKTVFAVMVGDQDSLVDHQKALDLLEGEEVYALVPLTTDSGIHQVYVQHAENMSDPESMKERRTIVTAKSSTRRSFQATSSTGAATVGSTSFTDANAQFLTNAVPVGSVIRLTSPASIELDNVDRTELIIGGVTSETEVSLVGTVTKGTEFEDEAVGTGTGAQVNYQLAQTSDVIVASVLIFLNGVQQSQSEYIVTTGGAITFNVPPGAGVAITATYEISPLSNIQYTVESQELTNFEIARDAAAVGEGYNSRRVTVTFADSVIADDGQDVAPFFMNAAYAGLISALAPNQPIANVPIPGFTEVRHIRRFSDTQFGTIAAGGVAVYFQDRDTSPVVLRNSITTDTTNVLTREVSIVNMVDYYAKFLRDNIQAIAGRFNITEDFIDNMLRPGINGVNRELITAGFIGPKTQILSIEQSEVQKDHLFVIEEVEFFAPANRIVITVRVI